MLEIKSFVFGPFQTNTYVITINNPMVNDQIVLVLDPACSNEYEQQQLLRYIENLSAFNFHLSIIATHGHLDHLWGAKWATDTWNTPVLMHEADIPMAKLMQQQYNMFGIRTKAEPFPVEDIKSARLCRSIEILNLKSQMSNFQLLETPGHTPGSISLYFPQDKVLFSGDTLFRMGYGRTDLPGGNIGQLIESLETLFALPPDTLVYPGHGEMTTIGDEKR